MPEKKNKFDIIQNYRDEFRALLLQAVNEGMGIVSKAVESKKYIGTHYNYPSLFYSKNGLPSFSTQSFGPTQYSDCFSKKAPNGIVDESTLTSFNNLISFVENKQDLNNRFFHNAEDGEESEMIIDMRRYFIKSTTYDAIEWYVHKFKSYDFVEKNGNVIIEKILNYIFNKELSIDIIIPILFIDFQFEKFQLEHNIEIVRLNDKQHLARSKVSSYNVSVHQSVLASCTHGLLLKNWVVPNGEDMLKFDILSKVNAYPLDIINRFFGSLRVALNLDTGYAQILAKPTDWTHHQTTDLPDIFGVTIRSYPSLFENYHWNIETVPKVSEESTKELKILFTKMLACEANSLQIAVNRLNTCLIRDNCESACNNDPLKEEIGVEN